MNGGAYRHKERPLSRGPPPIAAVGLVCQRSHATEQGKASPQGRHHTHSGAAAMPRVVGEWLSVWDGDSEFLRFEILVVEYSMVIPNATQH